jgi:hypothetical protein
VEGIHEAALQVEPYSGSARQIQELKSGTEEATGTTITLDDNNCVAGFEPTGDQGYEELQTIFGGLVASDLVFGVRFDRPDEADRYFTSNFDRDTRTAIVLQYEVGRRWYQTGNWFTCGVFGGLPGPRYTLGGLVAHELLGHGGGVLSTGSPSGERQAIRVENLYHEARHQLRRC